jgi:hypothetical protein
VVIDKILVDEEDLDLAHTQLLMQVGQFTAHDIAMVIDTGGCPEMSCVVTDALVGSCFPFVVPVERNNTMVTMADSSNCAVFTRSHASCPSEVGPGKFVREQIDGRQIDVFRLCWTSSHCT